MSTRQEWSKQLLSTTTAIPRPDSSLSSRSSLQPTVSNGSKQDRFYEVRESILRDTAPSDRSDGDTRSSSLDLPRKASRSLSLSRSSGDLRSGENSPLKPSMSVRKLRTGLRNGSDSPDGKFRLFELIIRPLSDRRR